MIMRNGLVIVLTVLLSLATTHANELRFSGILANSGEAGRTLVTFGEMVRRSGNGLAQDRLGRLWTRAGHGILNCYELDGRLVNQYKIERNYTGNDRIAATDDLIVMFIRGWIYTLPINAPLDTRPTRLLGNVTNMATDSFANRVLISKSDNSIGWLAPTDGKFEALKLDPMPSGRMELIVGPEGDVFVDYNKKVHRFDASGKEIINESWPAAATSERLQFFGDSWYGHAWHGTIKRYDAELKPSPGVVLGGASGSFIGFLPENPEIENGRAMLRLDDHTYAIAGMDGVIHLLYYDAAAQRMQLIRRIGSLTQCPTLAINEQGVIWAAGGTWDWEGLPDTPMPEGDRAGEPISQMVIMPNGYAVFYSNRYGKPAVSYGPYIQDGMTRVSVRGINTKQLQSPLEKNYPAAAYVRYDKKHVLLLISDTGKPRMLRISDRGQFYGDEGEPKLGLSKPIKHCTSLAAVDEDTLLLAADGAVITLKQQAGKDWKEVNRFTQWGDTKADTFGSDITIATSENRLWVSDTNRHRVLVFDVNPAKPLASFGQLDDNGNAINQLHFPTSIAVSGRRGVVFDTKNQRMVRLTLDVNE
ncbi:MAG: hypothetical protein CMJ19_09245 [Phycisphaeraceae bacterium]|nr:hypothetical protein [Phycisphaeraceae bacterium]